MAVGTGTSRTGVYKLMVDETTSPRGALPPSPLRDLLMMMMARTLLASESKYSPTANEGEEACELSDSCGEWRPEQRACSRAEVVVRGRARIVWGEAARVIKERWTYRNVIADERGAVPLDHVEAPAAVADAVQECQVALDFLPVGGAARGQWRRHPFKR